MNETQGPAAPTGRGGCTAQLRRRGKLLLCDRWHREWETPTHECDGIYWSDGEILRLQCTAETEYCGEQLWCEADQERHGDIHEARSKRFGLIVWNDESRPQPPMMLMTIGFGHRYGSHEADALMKAAATMQDAANRLEYLAEKGKP